jgi:hypothetical protein
LLSSGFPIGFAIVSLVGDDRTRRDVGAKAEQCFEEGRVVLFAAGEAKGEGVALMIGLQVYFRRKAAA